MTQTGRACARDLLKLLEEVEMARELLPKLDPQAVLEGHMTPIWFGSAINSLACGNDGRVAMASAPDQSAEPDHARKSRRLCL